MLEAHPVLLGTVGSLLAGAMTAVGALPVFAEREISTRQQDALLGFAAGVMLAASFFSLLIPSLAASERLYENGLLAASIAVIGLMIGAVTIAWINENVPHEHFLLGPEGPDTAALRKIWLFVIAITIHNLPEGMAVGVGFGGGNVANGLSLATGIGLQNAPEGLAVAIALMLTEFLLYHRRKAG